MLHHLIAMVLTLLALTPFGRAGTALASSDDRSMGIEANHVTDWLDGDEEEHWLDGQGEDEEVLFSAMAEPARGEEVADVAMGLLGLSYRWAGISPQTGFDCSGLVYYVYEQFGVTLSRDTFAQVRYGMPVARDELEPGDLVFFANTYVAGVAHVGIYVGDDRFVHAVQPGIPVTISLLWDGYWGPRYIAARRVL